MTRKAVPEGMTCVCGKCQYQATSKGSLDWHKRKVHGVMKNPCAQCHHQTSKGDLAHHKRAVHEGIKFSCRHCQQQATAKGDLSQHIRAVH